MNKKEIEKNYLKKIDEIKKYNKAYFEKDDPLVSDKYYDDIKQEILQLENKQTDSKKIATDLQQLKEELEITKLEAEKIIFSEFLKFKKFLIFLIKSFIFITENAFESDRMGIS